MEPHGRVSPMRYWLLFWATLHVLPRAFSASSLVGCSYFESGCQMANIFFCCFNLVNLGSTGIRIAQAGVRLAVLVPRKRQFEARVEPVISEGFRLPLTAYMDKVVTPLEWTLFMHDTNPRS